jgi:hypothetical protein
MNFMGLPIPSAGHGASLECLMLQCDRDQIAGMQKIATALRRFASSCQIRPEATFCSQWS